MYALLVRMTWSGVNGPEVQNDLLEAKVEEVRALVDYRIAITTLESATGKILPDELLPEYE